MTGKEILDLPMGKNDADAATVRDYLRELLWTIWNEGEGFSGKRPFGNSGWEHELYTALVTGGALKGTVEDGWADGFDRKQGSRLIFSAIDSLQ